MAFVLASAIYLAYVGQWGTALLAGVLLVLLWYVHRRLGPVFMALRKLYKGNVAACEYHLATVKRPNKLPSIQKGYYHFCRGYIAMQRNERDDAVDAFTSALEHGLRLENDRAVAHVSLASLYQQRGTKAKARENLNAAKALKHNKVVAQAIADVERGL